METRGSSNVGEMTGEIVRKIGDSILEEYGMLNAELMELPKPFRTVRSLDAMRQTKVSGRVNRETAFINRDGILIVHYWSKVGHLIAEAWDHIGPTEPHYLELCSKHGLKHVGDRNVIALEWNNGGWKKVA
ncbi:MAG: hypothetical protein DKT66_20285 [Candidatus Melainabacteria bacterium]|nr:MAG: hypothetical protein DKT66_20285 [Candidatus Melainabacteria bacterium]